MKVKRPKAHKQALCQVDHLEYDPTKNKGAHDE